MVKTASMSAQKDEYIFLKAHKAFSTYRIWKCRKFSAKQDDTPETLPLKLTARKFDNRK